MNLHLKTLKPNSQRHLVPLIKLTTRNIIRNSLLYRSAIKYNQFSTRKTSTLLPRIVNIHYRTLQSFPSNVHYRTLQFFPSNVHYRNLQSFSSNVHYRTLQSLSSNVHYWNLQSFPSNVHYRTLQSFPSNVHYQIQIFNCSPSFYLSFIWKMHKPFKNGEKKFFNLQ